MRILLITPTAADQSQNGLITFYKRAFSSLGHQTHFASIRDRYGLAERLRHHYSRWSYRGVPPDVTGEHLVRQAEVFKPDLTIVGRGERLRPEPVRRLRELSRFGCINIYPDSPFVIPGNGAVQMMSTLSEYSRVFTFSRTLIPVFEQLGARSVSWLPFGFDPEIHQPAPHIDMKFSATIAYLGAWGPIQEAWLEPLAPFGLGIYGPGWQKLSGNSTFRWAWRKGHGVGLEMAAAIGGADIVFNLVRAEHGCAHSMKTFEIPACGGFMLTNWTEEQAEFFEDGKHCVFFHTREEMLDKAAYYAKHDAERRRISEAGSVLARHYPYTLRATQILKECTE